MFSGISCFDLEKIRKRMGSHSSKELVKGESVGSIEEDQVVQVVDLESTLHKKINPASELESFAEVHLEKNLDSISDIISALPLGGNNKKSSDFRDGNKNNGLNIGKVNKVKDAEVEDAIAELEETFRTLDRENSGSGSTQLSNNLNNEKEQKSKENDWRNSAPPTEDRQQLAPSSGSSKSAESPSNWESLQSSPSPYSPKEMGGAKPNTGPPMWSSGQDQGVILPRRPQLHSRADLLSRGQRSRSQHGRTPTGLYSPPGNNSQNRLHQHRSPLVALSQQTRGSSSQILVIQQQNQRLSQLLLLDPLPKAPKGPSESPEWIYQPPKIEGFDIDKFKEVNRKDNSSPISYTLPLPREEPENQDMKNNVPISKEYRDDYTKDELELIACLEREIF